MLDAPPVVAVNPRAGIPPWLAITIAAACGGLVAVQTRLNGALGLAIGDGFVAAVISFGSGLVILTVCLMFVRSGRTGLVTITAALREGSMPWWTVLGGLSGAFLVLGQGITGAVVGVALFSVALVAGQTVSGLILDRVGFGPNGRVATTWPRLIGAALAMIAVLWSVSGQIGGDVPLWMLGMPLIAGFGTGWQSAVNGRVRARAHSALTATFLNFVVGTSALVAVLLIRSIFVGWPESLPAQPMLYLGGAIGCVFIGVNAFLVAHTGVLLLGLGTVAGQLIGSVVIDALAAGGVGLSVTTVSGAALALVAVGVATFRRPRARG
ncbi:DMT family transporter [Mycetocola manganoxydans]|uniref:DMT family transporter n=1 Tax=Mycetocola manganoxydans TaxID=699879 RepID=UPI0019C3AF9E|nr:DMT family transporter [Mycetocola manganoxydans]GHD52417.1 membrane protein [Mycetocola manganoxydans]